jgi:serine/threonine protein kinase
MGSHDDATTPGTPAAAAAKSRSVQLPHRYRVLDVIGEGGMGRVYRALDLTLGREVAIKVIETDLLPGPDKTMQRERFAREARAAARLVHPNIVAVHDVDPDAGWLVMDLVEGTSLRELVQRGKQDPVLVRAIAEQVLSALDCAHAAGVIHRDVKPSNIMLDDQRKATLVDFGVARLVDAELTRTGESLGTPAYMAPEQIRGATVDARTDLYSLAATLYELVTGARMVAFESPSASAIARVEDACPGEPGLAHVIARSLQADPDERFASAREAIVALGRRPRRRRRMAVVGGAVALAALATTGALWLRGGDAQDPRLATAFTLAQRGENEKALGVIAEYIAEHPDDSGARTLQYLASWWANGTRDPHIDELLGRPLAPAQRAMISGIDLITQRRESEAIAYLMNADAEHPGHVEILYALGEAEFHGQQLADGVATLERAFHLDPRWEVALHHVIELRLSRGEGAQLVPIADQLRAHDPAAAATLDCQIAISDHRYAEAAESAEHALASVEQIPELYICRAQAQTLAGDLEGARTTAKHAFQLWPIDYREWGGFAAYAETFLYRGQLDEYLDFVRGKPSGQRGLTLALWRPSPDQPVTAPTGPGMRMPPIGVAEWILIEATRGVDEVATYASYPEPELRGYGAGLWAEKRGNLPAAITAYRAALAVPARGDLHMLLSHHLARALYASGDRAGAAAACADVIAPRVYEGYRAALMPDCMLWLDDPDQWRKLDTIWQGTFAHPSVIEARHRLAHPGVHTMK